MARFGLRLTCKFANLSIMTKTGATHALKLSAVIAAIAISAAACGSSSNTSASGDGSLPTTSATPTTDSTSPSTGPTTGPSDAPSPTPTVSLPPGCHGMAVDLETTVAILTDGSECPGSVNQYWHQELGNLWTEPTFISYRDGQIPKTACTEDITDPDEVADNAFFCSADDTVSYSEDLLDKLYDEGGPYLPVVVLEHELGHRANFIARSEGVISRSEENQADCDAGLTTSWARTNHRLPFADVLKSAGLLYTLGDTRNFGDEIALSPNAHGSPSQRVIAFSRGYAQNKVSVCRALGQSPTGSVTGT
jgi:uncharacterized protein